MLFTGDGWAIFFLCLFFLQFLSNPAVTFGTAIAAFYLPVIIMTVLYIHISLASRSRVSKHKPEKKEKKGIK